MGVHKGCLRGHKTGPEAKARYPDFCLGALSFLPISHRDIHALEEGESQRRTTIPGSAGRVRMRNTCSDGALTGGAAAEAARARRANWLPAAAKEA